MKWFLNLNVLTKIITGMMIVSGIAVAIGFLGIRNISTVNNMLNDMYDNNLVPISTVCNTNIEAIYHNRAIYDHIIATSNGDMDTIEKDMKKNEVKITEHLDIYRKTKLTDKEKDILKKIDDT